MTISLIIHYANPASVLAGRQKHSGHGRDVCDSTNPRAGNDNSPRLAGCLWADTAYLLISFSTLSARSPGAGWLDIRLRSLPYSAANLRKADGAACSW